MAARSKKTQPTDDIKPKTRVELHVLKGFIETSHPRRNLGGVEIFQEGEFPPQATAWVRGGLAEWVEVEI